MEYIPVLKNAIPYTAKTRIAGETYEFAFNYNAEYDYFTVTLSRDGSPISTRKIIYGLPLFPATDQFPKKLIVPLDSSLAETRVGWEQLEKTVFLCVIEPDKWEGARV
ncbi:MAG: hypothetical protein JRD89_02775 [Deltaproteobacteria bacterium]|nr:hypothetical protein [Deltaproteobacteria bacterium]